MKIKLKHISSIQTGVFAKTLTNGEIIYLQAKHFNEQGKLKGLLHPDIKSDKIAEKHLLRKGDILFAAKGKKNYASIFEANNLPAVASTSFFVIRINSDHVLADYLKWFLNLPRTIALLKTKAIGTSISSISKLVLAELEIPIPNIQTQKVILKVFKLREKEKELIQEIEKLKEKQIQQQIIKVLK